MKRPTISLPETYPPKAFGKSPADDALEAINDLNEHLDDAAERADLGGPATEGMVRTLILANGRGISWTNFDCAAIARTINSWLVPVEQKPDGDFPLPLLLAVKTALFRCMESPELEDARAILQAIKDHKDRKP